MPGFSLRIVTPEGLFFEGEALRVSLRTKTGDVGVLRGHEPYVAALGDGEMRLKLEAGEKAAQVAGGFIRVAPGQTTVVARSCVWKQEGQP